MLSSGKLTGSVGPRLLDTAKPLDVATPIDEAKAILKEIATLPRNEAKAGGRAYQNKDNRLAKYKPAAGKGMAGLFGKPKFRTRSEGAIDSLNALRKDSRSETAGFVLAAMLKKWPRAEVVKVFEGLISCGNDITSDRNFRGLLDRDDNLLANQITREANTNIAYRGMDFELPMRADGTADVEEFFARLDALPPAYKRDIEDRATGKILENNLV